MTSFSLLKRFALIAPLIAPLVVVGETTHIREQMEHAVGTYEKAWGEPDSAKRAAYLAEVWAADGVYRDPSANIRGAAALSVHIGKFLADFPAAQISRSSKIDAYGTSYRVLWKLQLPGAPAMDGMDIGELTADGRIASITGFFGPLVPTELSANEAVAARYLKLLFGKFDLVEMDKIIAKDAIYTQAIGLPYGGRYVGLPEWTQMYGKAQPYFDIRVGEPVFFSSKEGDQVIAHFPATFHSKKSNKEMTLAVAELFALKDGKITRINPFYFDTKTFVEFLNESAPKE